MLDWKKCLWADWYFLYEITVDVDGLLFEQKLHSYDQQGNCILVCYKSVYESEAIAKKQYDDRKKLDNDNSVLQGNVLYSSNEGHCTQKKSEDWENYLWWVDSDVEHEKLYFSKPITNNESSLPADTAASTSESAAPPAPETSVSESQGNTASNDGNIYADKLKFAVNTTITEQDIKRLKATTDDYCTSVAVIDGLEELIITSFDKDGKVVNIDMRSQCENADKTKECFDGTYYDYIDNSLKKAIGNYVYISGFKDGLNKSDYLGFSQSGDNGAYYFSKN